ncbi:MAG: HU family DNA-binding protein [bacterium]
MATPKTAKTGDIAQQVANETGMTLKQARAGIAATFAAIAKALKSNDRVSITGIGVFSKTVRPAQKGGAKAKNPFTGAMYTTKPKPASTKVKFRAGKGFKAGLGGR